MYIQRVQRTGGHPLANIVHLRRAVDQAQGLRELLPLAAILSRKTETMVNGRKFSEDDIQQIAAPLAKISFLLTALTRLRNRHDRTGGDAPLVRDLAERYRDIEGRIKEMRNDLARAESSRVP